MFARALVRAEEKQAVMFDWTTEQSAEDVTLEHGPLHAGRLQERIIGVERVIAEVFIYSSMKIIGTAESDRLHAATGTAPERRIVKRGLDLELLNRLRGGHGYRYQVVLAQGIGVNAVELEIILRSACAVDRDVLRVAAKRRVV